MLRHDEYQLSTAVDNSSCKSLHNLVGNCQGNSKIISCALTTERRDSRQVGKRFSVRFSRH